MTTSWFKGTQGFSFVLTDNIQSVTGNEIITSTINLPVETLQNLIVTSISYGSYTVIQSNQVTI